MTTKEIFDVIYNYALDVVEKRIVACKKHIWACKRFISDIEKSKDDNYPYYFDVEEVLDFYEYLKEKKKRQKDILWKNIQEDEPTNEEVEIINNYIQNDSNDTISLDDLAKDLGINE